MSTDVAVQRASEALPATLPELPQSLFVAVRAIVDATIPPQRGVDDEDARGHYVAPKAPTREVVASAAKALPQAIAAIAPVQPAVLRAWIKALAKALPIGNVQGDPDRVQNATRAIVEACGNMPAECFTDETRAAVLRECKFFPAPAELYAILAPVEQRAKATVRALRQLADYKPPEPQPAPLTPEQRAELADKMRGLADKMRADSEDAKPAAAKVTPRFITPLQAALSARANNAPILRPDWMRALAEYDAGNTSEYQGGE